MKTPLAPLSSTNLVERLKADLIALYQPVNSQELFAIQRIANAQLALHRCSLLESKLVEASLNAPVDPNDPSDPNRPPEFPFLQPSQLKAWQTFLRYQAQTERLYRRALEELERLIAMREECQDEAEEIPIMPFALPQLTVGRTTAAAAGTIPASRAPATRSESRPLSA